MKPEPRPPVTFRLDRDTKERLEALAKARGQTRNDLLERWTRERLRIETEQAA